MDDWALQTGHGVRFEWGQTGAERLAAGAACLVIVDVLSFSTSVTVAVDAGTRVYPYRWRDESASVFAEQMDAARAVGRSRASAAAPWSLSPAALRRAPFTPRLVLPSPNGSAIAAAAGDITVLASCLRNAKAVSRWLRDHRYGTTDRPVAVIAAGERWPDGSLRPAIEDLLGAGAVISALLTHGARTLSPEAAVAAAAFTSVPDPGQTLQDCASGRELTRSGFGEDVAVAAELNVSAVVPLLVDGAFESAG